MEQYGKEVRMFNDNKVHYSHHEAPEDESRCASINSESFLTFTSPLSHLVPQPLDLRQYKPNTTPDSSTKGSLRELRSDIRDGQLFNLFNKAFVTTVLLASESRTRGSVQTLWNTILYSWFAPSEYIISFKEGSLKDISVLELRWIEPSDFPLNESSPSRISVATRKPSHRNGRGDASSRNSLSSNTESRSVATPGSEPRIFMLQYWSSIADTPIGWQAARESFSKHMSTQVAPGRRMLCAIAIGSRYEIYGWDGVRIKPGPERRHYGTFDLRDMEGRRQLERQLAFVERNGLAYARASRPWSQRTS